MSFVNIDVVSQYHIYTQVMFLGERHAVIETQCTAHTEMPIGTASQEQI